MGSISRIKKRKEWLMHRIEKQIRRLSRKKKNHYSIGKTGMKRGIKNIPNILKLPSRFSLIENTVETVNFFSNVFDEINKSYLKSWIAFDMGDTEYVTPDAIMYLIAILRNSRKIKTLKIKCSGNIPNNKEAADLINRIGFYDYVKAISIPLKSRDVDRIQILEGYESNGQVTSTICDFVCEKLNSNSILSTKRLYPMLVELMTNVKQHAYGDKLGSMNPKWYIYVENHEEVIKFIFLDTGLGIPNTIRKNWIERIKDIFGKIIGEVDDASYMEAALKGEFRTETKQGYRGKGLPEIYNAILNEQSRLCELTLLSGHGMCMVENDQVIHKKYVDGSFDGTMFVWSYKKGEITDGRN